MKFGHHFRVVDLNPGCTSESLMFYVLESGCRPRDLNGIFRGEAQPGLRNTVRPSSAMLLCAVLDKSLSGSMPGPLLIGNQTQL